GWSATYTMPLAVRLGGDLDVGALEQALGDVVERHESLRTVFAERGGVARQEILPATTARARLRLRTSAITEAELSTALSEAASVGFDLARDLPLRAHVYGLSVTEHVLLLVLHHIAGDGWSLGVLGRDLGLAYAARRNGRAPAFPPLAVQYADYTLWQRGVLGEEGQAESALGRQVGYWRERLRDLPEQLDLPYDRGRPAVASYRGDIVPLRLGAELHRQLVALARSAGASLFMVLQAGLAAVLTRLWAGAGIPIRGPASGPAGPGRGRPCRVLRDPAGAADGDVWEPELWGACGSGAGREPVGLWASGRPVRAVGGGPQPDAVVIAASVVPGFAGAAERGGCGD